MRRPTTRHSHSPQPRPSLRIDRQDAPHALPQNIDTRPGAFFSLPGLCSTGSLLVRDHLRSCGEKHRLGDDERAHFRDCRRQGPFGAHYFLCGRSERRCVEERGWGTRYKPVFDNQPVQSIGSLALDPSHPSTLWVGTGEAWTRNSVSIGDGIYKSTDSGDTWKNMGLPQSERIAKILVDPKNSNIVYACVAGKLWSDSPDRGLYKTVDGGATWRLVLRGANLSTGCSSLAQDPADPNVIIAALWDFRRKGWTFRSGGESATSPSGSGLFRSMDGGATWREFSPADNAGFPGKPYGRIAVAIAPSDPKRIYAYVESTDSALYVSNDAGKTWQQRTRAPGWCGVRFISPISWWTPRIPIAYSRPMAR